jgi:hypothetical protein
LEAPGLFGEEISMSTTNTINIFIDDELGIDAFEILSNTFNSVSFMTDDHLPVPNENKEHPSYSMELLLLAGLVIPGLQVSSAILSIAASIFSLMKLRKASGAAPTIRIQIDGKEVHIVGETQEAIVRAIEDASKKINPTS